MSTFFLLRRKRSLTWALPLAFLAVVVLGMLRATGEVAPSGQAPPLEPQQDAAQTHQNGGTHPVPRLTTENSSGPASVASESVLRVYRCDPGNAEALAAELTAQFRNDPRVRVVLDRRTAQLLVMAPAELQSQIAASIPDPQAGKAPPLPTSSPRPATASQAPAANPGAVSEAGEFLLRHATPEEFELALVRMLGDRLSPVASPDPDASAYELRLANGDVLRLSLGRGSNRVRVRGASRSLQSASQLVGVLDVAAATPGRGVSLLSLRSARSPDVRRALNAISVGQYASDSAGATPRVAMVFQPDPAPPTAPATAPGPAPNGQLGENAEEAAGGLINPVQVQVVEGMDLLVIRGHERDVQLVRQLIEQIEMLGEELEPRIEVLRLRHVNCRTLTTLLSQLYQDVYSTRQGSVSITALVKPNALLLAGRPESVATVIDLVKRLDRPVEPSTQFRVFRLKNTAAETVVETIAAAFPESDANQQAGLEPRVLAFADFRTNSLVVRASPRDMAEVELIVERLDAQELESVNEVRVFRLKNSLAEDLAPILQDAITGQMYGQRTGQRAVVQRMTGLGADDFERKSVRLRFVTIDSGGERVLSSGILTDVQVTADARANVLIVTASADSMPLIQALIEELDQLPTAEAQVKVFTIINGDASNLMSTLSSLFGQQAQAGDLAVRTGATGGDSSLVSLQFAVDVRSNSIIATGAAGDLEVVEAILTRLDESDLRKRQTVVMRLRNAAAENIASAVTDFLTNELQAQQPATGLLSTIERVDQEVVIVPELITNSLIISASAQYYDRVTTLVEELDRRPPMVVIQVLLAAVTMTDDFEFGVELGLQDSILFNRSSNDGVPGFLFNNQQLGNNTAVPGSNIVGSQGLSSFSLGRTNTGLGYGGLVLSASSEAVSVLIRSLKADQRVDVLGRPQIMTMDNVAAMIHVGERVPVVTSVSPATIQGSQTFSTSQEDVGLMLQVTPKISPDGLVVMEVVATRSEVGPEDQGIPVSISAGGDVLRSPRIEIVEAETTVSAMDGHTVVIGGLITKRKQSTQRKVPWLGDLPVIGRLFRYDSESSRKEELLIILTPRVVENDEDAELIKQTESARMDWCLSDVLEMHDARGLRSRNERWRDDETPVIYPDLDPTGQGAPATAPRGDEPVTIPQRAPFRLEPLEADPGGGATTQPPTQDSDDRMSRLPGSVQPAAYESASARQTRLAETSSFKTRLRAAAGSAGGAVRSGERSFAIPFQVDRSGRRDDAPVEVQLYFSTDYGANWRLWDRVRPDRDRFVFEAFADGEYWFQIRTLDASGRLSPPSSPEPELRVIVDTR